MKNWKGPKPFILLFVVVAFISCNSDDDQPMQLNTALVGEWERSDSDETFTSAFIFESNAEGLRVETEIDTVTQTATSSALAFIWSTNNSLLRLDFDGQIETTEFSINAEGQLLLSDISNVPFNKRNDGE